MSDLKQRFDQAAKDAMQLPKRPDNNTLLELYGLFKQGSVGDVAGKRPGMLDLKGRAKYDAWARLKGRSQESAMQTYVDLVERLKGG